MNVLTILLYHPCIKKSPINTGFTGLINITLYFRNQLLDNTLSLHSLCNLYESGYVSTYNVVAFLTALLSCIIQIVEDVNHDTLQFCINLLDCPRKSLAVLAHFQSR